MKEKMKEKREKERMRKKSKAESEEIMKIRKDKITERSKQE